MSPTVESASQALPGELVVLARELANRMESLPLPNPRWPEYVALAQELAQFLDGADEPVIERRPANRSLTPQQVQEFGRLLRDRRNAAGFTRLQLARKAHLSDATIKFTETARQPPSRATLIRLLAIVELGLTWDDVPWETTAATPARSALASAPGAPVLDDLNCYITPAYEPVRMVMDMGRFLNGAGGHVEQTYAYLDHQSAAAYLAMCEHSPVTVAVRGSLPLLPIGKKIVRETSPHGLHVIALGAGDARLETRLAQHLAEHQATPDVRLCLFDISQPLLSAGLTYATEAFKDVPGVDVWALQGNFHHLPQYAQLRSSSKGARKKRVYCMLGNTLANLDNEPRFFQHSFVDCVAGDLLVLDVQLAHGSTDDPASIRSQEPAFQAPFSKAHAEWLAGPIHRHCRDVTGVEFTLELNTQCPMPGSYALDAIATVKAKGQPDRRFSMFRFKRYDVVKLAQSLQQLGWEQLQSLAVGDVTDRPSRVMLFVKV